MDQVSDQVSDQAGGTAGGTGGTAGGTVSEAVLLLINTIGERVYGISESQTRLKIKSRR